MLDTNALSSLMNDRPHAFRDRLYAAGPDRVCTSVIVAAELRFGAAKKRSARLIQLTEMILGEIEALPFDEPASRAYADIRAALQRAGTPIGGNDLLIAAHAVSLGLVVVTANTEEFDRVPGLSVENWSA